MATFASTFARGAARKSVCGANQARESLDVQSVLKIRDEKRKFPEAANSIVKALRQVFSLGPVQALQSEPASHSLRTGLVIGLVIGAERLACQGAHSRSGRLLRLDSQRAENPKRNHGYYGHKTSKEIVRYTQGAQQQLLARNAFGKGQQLTTIVSHRSRMAIVGHLNQRKALKMLPNS